MPSVTEFTNHYSQTVLLQVLQHYSLLEPSALLTAKQQAQQKGQHLFHYLIDQQLLADDKLAQTIAEYFHMPLMTVESVDKCILHPDFNQLDFLRAYQGLMYQHGDDHNSLLIISDPDHLDLQQTIQFSTQGNVNIAIMPYGQLVKLINQHIGRIIYPTLQDPHAITESIQTDGRIVELVSQILNDALHRQASDIHLESDAVAFRVRFRIDGLLHRITHLPVAITPACISHIKVLANLDIAEKRLPQDGRFQFNSQSGFVRDCRVSTCPTIHGEKMVIRLLSNQKQLLSIDKLGLEAESQKILSAKIQQPQGLILVTGPTGSGKTVTLYTLLNQLNTVDRNIVTVEDPVEIQLPGINQVHVNSKIQLNFARVLRTFLRQDPDIIMVGEIRDVETASMAIRAAHTGHLVFATLHTNSAVATIIRLRDMGIAAFNLSSSLTVIIAQRLVRRLCGHCKQSQGIPTPEFIKRSNPDIDDTITVFSPRSCHLCAGGYQGRLGIFEIAVVTQALNAKIVQQVDSHSLMRQAIGDGMQTLAQSAWCKVRQGETSLQEVYRVLGDEY